MIILGRTWGDGLGFRRISIMRRVASSHFQEACPRKFNIQRNGVDFSLPTIASLKSWLSKWAWVAKIDMCPDSIPGANELFSQETEEERHLCFAGIHLETSEVPEEPFSSPGQERRLGLFGSGYLPQDKKKLCWLDPYFFKSYQKYLLQGTIQTFLGYLNFAGHIDPVFSLKRQLLGPVKMPELE